MVILNSRCTLISDYLLVYGTLREGRGNNRAYRLSEDTDHVGTFKLPGWRLRGLSGFYTGNPDDYIVVDMYDMSCLSSKELYEKHQGIDGLESVMHDCGYKATIIPMKHPITNQDIFAKIYYSDPYYDDTGNDVDYVNGRIDHSDLDTIEYKNYTAYERMEIEI